MVLRCYCSGIATRSTVFKPAPLLRVHTVRASSRPSSHRCVNTVTSTWTTHGVCTAQSNSNRAMSQGCSYACERWLQDFCIECPSTGSLFSLKDGSVLSWYPGNPVLAALTPKETCRPLEVSDNISNNSLLWPAVLMYELLHWSCCDDGHAQAHVQRTLSSSSLITSRLTPLTDYWSLFSCPSLSC